MDHLLRIKHSRKRYADIDALCRFLSDNGRNVQFFRRAIALESHRKNIPAIVVTHRNGRVCGYFSYTIRVGFRQRMKLRAKQTSVIGRR